jgi:uncharacterized protein (DUF169 family)
MNPFTKLTNRLGRAMEAIARMPAIQPPVMQGYQFVTGERVKADIGGLRAGCSDLIVRPFLYNELNLSPFCLGAGWASACPIRFTS